MLITLANIADAVLAEGLASPDEIEQAIAELRAFTEDSSTVVGCRRIFQVWGTKLAAKR